MRILVTGATGQDGSYLVEQLTAAGHDVFGLVRRYNAQTPAVQVVGDMGDRPSLERALRMSRPGVVYNLAAVTSPGGAWTSPQPAGVGEVTGLGVVKLLDAMLFCAPDARLVHASSSAIYDPGRYGLYGAAKTLAHEAVAGYRSRLWCANAVLFSHTSPRQDARFLARRVCSTLQRIAAGSGERLELGDVDARRDWGHAPDYMRALPMIAAQDVPGDHVIATGLTHSVRDLVQVGLDHLGLEWDQAVAVDLTAVRVGHEIAAPEARMATTRRLGWKAETSFTDTILSLL